MMEIDDVARFARQALDESIKVLVENFPHIKRIVSEIVEVVFIPKAMFRQLILAIALETGALTLNQLFTVLNSLHSNFSSHSRLIRQLHSQQQNSDTQDEWMSIAEQIDTIQSNDVWRSDPSCALYESERISARVDEFVHLIRRRDIFDLMFTLRGGIARNKFGLLHEGLFSKALAGSKVLVETYHNVVCAALDFVCDSPVPPGDDPIPTDARLAFFNETRHSYGRTALMLSGGAALGFYHAGVVKALMENGVLPRVLSGASAGSIVCSMIGTRTDEECARDLFKAQGTTAHGHSGFLMLDFFRPILGKDNAVTKKEKKGGVQNDIKKVWFNTAGAFHDAKKTWQLLAPIGVRNFTSLLFDVLTGQTRPKDILMNDTDHFRSCCRANIGEFTFQEAFDRTGRILNIIVSPQNRSDPPRLLNYLTAPHVLVWSAAVASSSLPGVFEPNKLLVKDADGTERYESASAARFLDGSMEADLPMQQLSEMFNVNHFIISQANPHAAMFASFNINKSVWSNNVIGLWYGVLLFVKKQVKSWFGNMIELISGRRMAPLWDTRRGFGSQFFTQEYEGRDCDISLIPWAGHRSLLSAFLHVIYNPSFDEFIEWGKAAERETWRYIPKIKSHVAEEMTLDRCVQRLRKQLLLESWEAKRGAESTAERMGKRVPSFFTSPSLVNMGGLNITDRFSLQDMQEVGNTVNPPGSHYYGNSQAPPGPSEFRSGWKGMGLQGNHSSASMARSESGGSGLFFEDDESDDEERPRSHQMPGEVGNMLRGSSDSQIRDDRDSAYLKTTSMADFYYRKSKSHDNLAERNSLEPIDASTSFSSGFTTSPPKL